MDEKIRLVEYEGEKGWSRHIALLRRVSVLLSPFVVIFISLKDDVAAFEFGLLKTRRADIGATNEACISHAGSFLNGGINFHPLILHTCSITRRFGRELGGWKVQGHARDIHHSGWLRFLTRFMSRGEILDSRVRIPHQVHKNSVRYKSADKSALPTKEWTTTNHIDSLSLWDLYVVPSGPVSHVHAQNEEKFCPPADKRKERLARLFTTRLAVLVCVACHWRLNGSVRPADRYRCNDSELANSPHHCVFREASHNETRAVSFPPHVEGTRPHEVECGGGRRRRRMRESIYGTPIDYYGFLRFIFKWTVSRTKKQKPSQPVAFSLSPSCISTKSFGSSRAGLAYGDEKAKVYSDEGDRRRRERKKGELSSR